MVDFTENIVGPDVPAGLGRAGLRRPGVGTGHGAGAGGHGPVATPGVGAHAGRRGARWRRRRSPRLASGAVVADFGKVYAAVPTVTFRTGHGGADRDHARRLPARRAAAAQVSTTHGTQHTDMSYSYVQRGGRRGVPPLRLPRVPLLPGRRPRRAAHGRGRRRPAPATRRCPTSTPPPSRRRTPGSTPSSSWRRHSALFSAQEQFIDTPTREKGPVAVGRVQRVADGHGGLRRAEPDAQVTARVRRVPGALLAPQRCHQQDLPHRARRARHQRVHRDLRGVGVAVLAAHRRPRPGRARCTRSLASVAGYVARSIDPVDRSRRRACRRPTSTTPTPS